MKCNEHMLSRQLSRKKLSLPLNICQISSSCFISTCCPGSGQFRSWLNGYGSHLGISKRYVSWKLDSLTIVEFIWNALQLIVIVPTELPVKYLGIYSKNAKDFLPHSLVFSSEPWLCQKKVFTYILAPAVIVQTPCAYKFSLLNSSNTWSM